MLPCKPRFLFVLALTGTASFLDAARPDFLTQALVDGRPAGTHGPRRFTCTAGPATRVPAGPGLSLPPVPLFHPHRPELGLRPNARFHCPVHITFPAEFLEALPEALRERIRESGFEKALEIHCLIQNLPWRHDVPLLFRPHYWGLSGARAGEARRFRAEIFEVEPSGGALSFSGEEGLLSAPSTLRLEKAGAEPASMAMDGLDYHYSRAFWTLTVVDDPAGPRMAATLHILLSDRSCAKVMGLLPAPGKASVPYGAWLERMEAHPELAGRAWLRALGDLTRPVLEVKSAAPAARPAPDPANLWRGGGARAGVVAHDGIYHVSQTVACKPGERFRGECVAKAPAMKRGQIRIGIRFEADGGGVLWETKAPSAVCGADPDPAYLWAEAQAPAGAQRARLFLEATGMEPGARLRFDSVKFMPLPGAADAAPALPEPAAVPVPPSVCLASPVASPAAPAPAASPAAPAKRPLPPEEDPRYLKLVDWWDDSYVRVDEKGSAILSAERPCRTGEIFVAKFNLELPRERKGTAQVALAFLDDSGRCLHRGEVSLDPETVTGRSTDWFFLTQTGVAPTGATRVSAQWGARGCTLGSVRMDALYLLKRLDPAPAAAPVAQATAQVGGEAKEPGDESKRGN